MAYNRNFDREKYAEQQKEKMDKLQSQIKEIGDNFNLSPETLADYYSFAGRFYQYSARNNMLIYGQNRYATFCGSFKYYQDHGYSVKKGEHGLNILVPVTTTLFKVSDTEWKKISEATKEEKARLKKNEYETRKVQNFKIGSVFDISQTNIPPEEYPKYYSVGYKSEDHAAVFEGVKNYCENELNCPIEIADLHSIGLRGHYLPLENKIELNELLEDSNRLETALHEMGHAILHSDVFQDRAPEQIEFEADSIGLMFNSHFGFEFSETQKEHLAQQYRDMKAANEKSVKNDKGEKFDINKILDNVSNTYFEHIQKLSDYVKVSLLKNKIASTDKRFRDSKGNFNTSIEDIETQTFDEANSYYEDGQKYMIEGEVKPFICKRWQENGDNHIRFDACYETKSGTNHLYCVPEKMGTFLPDVATKGQAIVRFNNIENTNTIQAYCSKMTTHSEQLINNGIEK